MGGGEESKEDDSLLASLDYLPSSLTGVKLVDAPILFLVLSHKAFRKELSELHRVAVNAAEKGSHGRELFFELSRRFEFLKLVYKYHCAAEDEVIFLALDAEVKNVVPTYSLEHTRIDDYFSSIFHCLNLFTSEDGVKSVQFHELVCHTGAIQAAFCQHMRKEEEQVFPLLMQKFSSGEQASFVWQYICSVPIRILQEFLPWITDDKEDLIRCIELVVSKDALLQEVVISWVHCEKKSSRGFWGTYDEGARCYGRLSSLKSIIELNLPKVLAGDEQDLRKADQKHKFVGRNCSDGIHLWHSAIRKELISILDQLHHIRTSQNIIALSSIIVQLNFFLDILMFYSDAWDHIFHPVIKELPLNGLSPPYDRLVDKSQIEGLQWLLYRKFDDIIQLSSFMEMVCGELDLFVRRVSKSLTFLEKEMFSFISDNCSFEVQLCLFYSSLQMMPLGLLKHTIFWFSTCLSDEQSKVILNSIRMECAVASKPLASLLHEWIRMGYSGKTSAAKLRGDLHSMFRSRSSFLPEDANKGTSSSDEKMLVRNFRNCGALVLESGSATATNNSRSSPSASTSNMTENDEVHYSSKMNLHIFFPQMFQKAHYLHDHCGDYTSAASTFIELESRPMDHVLLFHKALIKDLECLVNMSAKLSENAGILIDFKRRFHLLRYLYQIHSDSEDEVAFPALETKEELQNICQAYTIDHKLEAEQFRKISHILVEMSVHEDLDSLGQGMPVYNLLCQKLHDACISMHKILSDHIFREEIELWPLFRQHFSIKEQEKIVGHMLGRTRAEILQDVIPWLMASLTPEEQQALISLWFKATKHTKFNEWLREWWGGMTHYDVVKADTESHFSAGSVSCPLEVVTRYLSKKGAKSQKNCLNNSQIEKSGDQIKRPGSIPFADQAHLYGGGKNTDQLITPLRAPDKTRYNKLADVTKLSEEAVEHGKESQTLMPQAHPLLMNQQELEDAIRGVSRDSTLDPQKKAYIIQNLLTSRWVATQQTTHLETGNTNGKEQVPGQSPSYQDALKSVFGCKHYKRNCKLLTPCCKRLYTCIRCHDEMTDHSVDRTTITKMCCMKCLFIQPLNTTCSSPACNDFSMAKYFCKICKLFDDERQIYHCPYCNLCRVGKGLGIDYFHCMTCNACMSRSLTEHVCREKCFEDNCPICHEYIFTSSSPVKALPCGHLMHSACFQDYTCSNYICPICSKSLGDMQVYFQMLDALLAEEKIPEEYAGRTQVILCNDCEKKGTAPFHWLYHKCPYCGSYNTRLL